MGKASATLTKLGKLMRNLRIAEDTARLTTAVENLVISRDDLKMAQMGLTTKKQNLVISRHDLKIQEEARNSFLKTVDRAIADVNKMLQEAKEPNSDDDTKEPNLVELRRRYLGPKHL